MCHGGRNASNNNEPQQHHDETAAMTITTTVMYNGSEASFAPTLMLKEPITMTVDHQEQDVQIDIDMPARGG